MGRTGGTSAPSWAAYFDHAEYCAQAAACYRLLNRPRDVEFWLSQALELQPRSRTRDRATYRIWRAENYLDLNSVEQACEVARSALPDLQSARSARNIRRVRRLQGHLVKYRGHSDVQDLLEQIDNLELS
jgi:tetratricopeptide (TPR) repeat protein